MNRKLAILGAVLIPLAAGAFVVQERASLDGGRLFGQVLDLVESRYVDSVDTALLYEKAARGLVSQLQDPYSELFSPRQLTQFNTTTAGRYGGLGLQIEEQPNKGVVVSKVFPHTPAEAAGVREGDMFVAIDTLSTRGWSSARIADSLRGTPGSKVSVSFARPGVLEPIKSSFTRAVIRVPAVPYAITFDKIGYIPLQGFNESSTQEVAAAVRKLLIQDGAKGLILDLRGNGGGYLPEATALTGLFIDRGPVVQLRDAGGRTEVLDDPDPGVAYTGPLAVLVDRFSASASEIFAGAIQDQYVARTYPEAQVIHLTGIADLITSLKTDKVDAGIIIATSAPEILQTNPEIGRLGEPILPVSQGAAFRKEDQDLRERFDRFMAAILADGTHAEMRQRWFEGDPRQVRMPEIPLPAEGPVLRLGTSVFVGLPYVGLVNGDYVGFDIELARRFAAREGIRLVMEPLEFSALIPALSSGKLDLIASALAITPERQKQVAFSTPYAEVSSVVLALKKNLPAATKGAAGDGAGPAKGAAGAGQGAGEGGTPRGFLAEIQASFQANFILEQRWKLIFTGLWVTVMISVASTIFGTLFGALICWLRMSPQPLLRWFGSSYIFLIRGLPVLLLLMLIFYVAFASVNIDPLLVAVIAFGMNFAAYVSEMFRTGIEGVDRGQTEAGIALGFTRVQTFIHIVLPQAARRILPVYRGEFISLVKMTSIVGYIGVQDLTKAGDIIRSRTFEAFFPLIMVAAIYFLVIWVLGLVLDHLDRRTDHKRRRKAGMHSA